MTNTNDNGTNDNVTTYREALKQAHAEALENDPTVFLMGEDVGRYGGSYAVSKGFLERFGEDRIRDTPLSESGFVGFGIGAAANGMKPIVEVMTVNFSLLAMDQIVNNAATLLHMSGGQINIPIVIRMATGAGRQLAAQHSHSWEGWYAHVPGLKVLTPATVTDARYMLGLALADPDPVVMFEHAALYNMKGVLESGDIDMTSAVVRRPGTDVTIVSWSAALFKALEAAETLAEEGIEAEVIDARALRPLDTETILASVANTHRAVVVDEGWARVGMAAEVSATIAEEAFYHLDAPVQRVTGVDVPIPYAKHMEDASVPQPEGIAEAVRAVVSSRV